MYKRMRNETSEQSCKNKQKHQMTLPKKVNNRARALRSLNAMLFVKKQRINRKVLKGCHIFSTRSQSTHPLARSYHGNGGLGMRVNGAKFYSATAY